MSKSPTLKSWLVGSARDTMLRANYWLNNYQETIWLIGDGRSGTTWVSDLINHNRRYREMFEPFHPEFVEEMKFLLPHQYVRPGSANPQLEKIAKKVFSGQFLHPRVDEVNKSRFYKGLLIKDIFANLFASWAAEIFPDIKIILLIRNPFSVALSKYKTRNWFWATEPMELLKQPALRQDYLAPFEELIRETSASGDYILNQVLIWSIINYVPLVQFESKNLHITFYEDIYAKPEQEIRKIFQYVRPVCKQNQESRVSQQIIDRPSRVVGRQSNILKGTSPIDSWKNEIGSKRIDNGLAILESFGLEQLYDSRSMPDHHIISSIQNKKAW